MCRYLRFLTVLLLLMMGVVSAHAQDEPLAGALPVPYGPSNMGQDFWVAFPTNWDAPGSTTYYLRFYITSNVRTQVKIWAGPVMKKVFYTIPNEVVTVDLTPIEGQMFIRGNEPSVPDDRIFKRRAVHIAADAPIVVYAMNRTSYTAEGMLLLPASGLGREYVVSSSHAINGSTSELPSQYMIIAPHNGTTITIKHPHRTPNHAAGESFIITLDSGDVWSAMTVGFSGDMSGVVIKSNHPIAVTAGIACGYIPNLLNFCCCNHLAEMLIPTEAWGKVYHAVHVTTRVRGDFYKVFAKEPNTKVKVNGVEYATLTQAGGEEGTGWFEYRALGIDVQEFTADKPIQVVQYNASQAYDGVASKPFTMVLTPMEQYYTEVLFCTPAADFEQNFLNFVCEKDDLANVEITPAGKNEWKPITALPGASVSSEYPTVIQGRAYVGMSFELKPGVYEMRSRRPFSGMLYGFSKDGVTSYAYPMGLRTARLDRSDTEKPGITKTQTCDGTVLAVATDMPDDESIRTNLSSITMGPDGSSNYELRVRPFSEGISRSTTYTLTVMDKSKPAQAIVMVTDQAGNVRYDTVTYGPSSLVMSPTPQDYGAVRLGEKKVMSLTLTNESDAPAQIQEILMSRGTEGFRVLSPTGQILLGSKGSSNASVVVEVEFTAAIHRAGSLQTYSDSVSVKDECGIRSLALVHTMIVKPMIEVTDVTFELRENQEATKEMIVRNISPLEGSVLTISNIIGPNHNPAVKIFDAKTGTALQFPFTLLPNDTRNLMVTANAPQNGRYRDTIFFVSDAMEINEGNDYGWLDLLVSGSASVGEGDSWSLGLMNVQPNPAGGPEVELEYSLGRRSVITIELLDMNGRVLRVVKKEMTAEAGAYRTTLDIQGLAAGTYFARIATSQEARVRRFVIVQ